MSGSPLSAFCNQLIRFFEELRDTFPEERDIRMALETIQGAKRINPGLVRDMFYEHVVKDLRDVIVRENVQEIIDYANSKIQKDFNEIMPALAIFDKHWSSLDSSNQDAIWKYLKVLVALCEKSKVNRI